jgi:transcription termination factor Rho
MQLLIIPSLSYCFLLIDERPEEVTDMQRGVRGGASTLIENLRTR